MKVTNSQLIKESDDCYCVQGSLTFDTVDALYKESLPLFRPLKVLTFNLSGVTTFDSAAMALLLAWLRYAKAQRKVVAFRQAPVELESLLKENKLDGIIEASA